MHRTSYITSKTGRKTHEVHFTSLYDGYKLVHKRMPILTFEDLTTTFEASTNASFDTNLLIFVIAIHLLVILHIMQCYSFNEKAIIIIKWPFFTCFRVHM